MRDSCIRMAMPPYPEDLFLKAVDDVIRANADVIPLCTDGSSFYLRPFMFGTDPVLGVRPASEYEFRIFGSPVGSYFSRMIKLRICDLDRVAPHGTGHVKAGLNYAMSLYAITEAHALGYDENLYLDSATRTYIEETGGANIFFITKEGKLVTPKSDTILPSITRDSILAVASGYLGIETEERPIELEEIKEFAECGLCGTAAVISPVESIDDHGTVYRFFSDVTEEESITGRIKKVLTEMQEGSRPSPEGWLHEVTLA
jgi:branched-chain amino acid aminotransferase